MKRFFTLISILAFSAGFTLSAGIDDIVNSLKTGNVPEIIKYFDNTVDITMPDKSNTYSKGQAEVILRDFFTNNPVKSFEVMHKGENAGSQYCIGTLTTKTGSFRTTVFMKQKGDKHTLQEIRFETK